MTEAIVLDADVQERLETKARQNNRSVKDVVSEAIANYLRQLDSEKLDREIVAFEAMHNELWRTCPMEWVAVHEHELIDRDTDKLALYRRIRAKYPNTAVLMRQVKESPVEEIWLRTISTGKIR